MKKNQDIAYGIIGLGRFGSALARTLAEAGQEVIVLDKDEDKIKDMRQYTEYAFVTENLSQETLAETGIQNCDVVIVCIGEQVDVSILTTMRVIEMGIPHVISKALSAVQNGKKIVDETAESFRLVTEGISQVAVRTQGIAEHSARQKESIRQATEGVNEIANVVQNNAATAEESAAASEELSSQAHLLKELVSKFQLNTGEET